MKALKKTGFVLLAIVSLLALLCSIAAGCVTNSGLMEQGFLQYADTKQFNLSPTLYGKSAVAIARYLDGQANTVPDPRDNTPFFGEEDQSDK